MTSQDSLERDLRDYEKREKTMTLAGIPALDSMPDSVSVHRLDFDHSEIVPGLIEGSSFLLVPAPSHG